MVVRPVVLQVINVVMMGNVHVTLVMKEINAWNVQTSIIRLKLDVQVPLLWLI